MVNQLLLNQTIVITGASSGIGEHVAEKAAKQGAKVILLARREEELQKLAEKIATFAVHPPLYYRLDVSCESMVNDVFSRIFQEVGTIDVLFNNAGFGKFETFEQTTFSDMEGMFKVNVYGVFLCTHAVLKEMIKQGHGHIITTASVAGKLATAKSSIYGATKHAVIGMMNALRMEVASANIHVTTINPGPIRTDFFKIADSAGTYAKSVDRYMLDPSVVADRIIEVMIHPKREVNLPWWMGIGAKLHQLAPAVVEKIAGSKLKMK